MLDSHGPLQHLSFEFYTGIHLPEKLVVRRRRFRIQLE